MAGPIQSAVNQMLGSATAVAVGSKKLSENERQASEKASKEAKATQEAEAKKAEEQQRQESKLASDTLEAKDTALEADLIRMGADPESARAFMNAKTLGLDTKGFGMLRKKGKFIGSYSSVAEKLSKDALTDSLSSRAINDEGFRNRILALGGTRKGRVEALVKASGGTK